MDQLTLCKTCSKEVAKSALTCPHCGAKLKMGVFEKVLLLIGVSFVVSIILANNPWTDELIKEHKEQTKRVIDKFKKRF